MNENTSRKAFGVVLLLLSILTVAPAVLLDIPLLLGVGIAEALFSVIILVAGLEPVIKGTGSIVENDGQK